MGEIADAPEDSKGKMSKPKGVRNVTQTGRNRQVVSQSTSKGKRKDDVSSLLPPQKSSILLQTLSE